MKKAFSLFIFCLGLSITTFSQNLVPNPSFEEIDSIPCSWTNSTYGEFNILFKDWFQPTRGTADVFTTYVDSSCYASCFSKHEKAQGTQMPHSGNVMGSIITYGRGCSFNSYREYMSVRLSKELNDSTTYYAEMYVSHGDYIIYATNNIGMYFSVDSLARHTHMDCGSLDFQPQILENSVIKDSLNWVKVSGYFRVTKPVKYLTIGNMLSNYKTTMEVIRRNRIDNQAYNAFYFVDDVLVRPCLIVTPDTLICKGNSISLVASGSPIYGWADKQKPNEILETATVFLVMPDVTTTYLVYGECDTLSVTVTIPESLNDTSICEGDSIIIPLRYAKVGEKWIGDSLITLSYEGNYTIERKFPGCIQSNKFILEYKPEPKLYLGEDSLICIVDTIYLDISEPNAFFKWDNNSKDPLRTITKPGYYSVEGWLDGCYNKNAINFNLEECATELRMPNVFTPNGDQINDILIPISNKGIVKMNFKIFDRNGIQLFQTNDVSINWKGNYQNKELAAGIYFWHLEYLDKNGIDGTLKGYLSLLR